MVNRRIDLDANGVSDMEPCHGHAGAFLSDHRGGVLKKIVNTEKDAYELLQGDPLRDFVPGYLGEAMVAGRGTFIMLKDVTRGFKSPRVMDCKMGLRTFLESDCDNQMPRADLYKKLVKIDAELPTPEEHAMLAVSKMRYMMAREALSSSSNLGFRIDGVTGSVLSSEMLKTVQSVEQVHDVFSVFLSEATPGGNADRISVVRQILRRLNALRDALDVSPFFSSHEMIGASCLFVADATAASVWLIDLAKCHPLPSGVSVTHTLPWEKGNHEDGWLLGLSNMIDVWKSVLAELCEGEDGTPLDIDVDGDCDDTPSSD